MQGRLSARCVAGRRHSQIDFISMQIRSTRRFPGPKLKPLASLVDEKVGRVRTCKLGLRRLEEEAAWIERYRQRWDARFDELDTVVEELKRKEKVNGRKKRK